MSLCVFVPSWYTLNKHSFSFRIEIVPEYTRSIPEVKPKKRRGHPKASPLWWCRSREGPQYRFAVQEADQIKRQASRQTIGFICRLPSLPTYALKRGFASHIIRKINNIEPGTIGLSSHHFSGVAAQIDRTAVRTGSCQRPVAM